MNMEWIKVTHRTPTSADADEHGEVLVWLGNHVGVEEWYEVDAAYYSHWAKIEPPKE